jgi:GDP-L-fucose synthase
MGWQATIPLEHGIAETYKWFLDQPADGLRMK